MAKRKSQPISKPFKLTGKAEGMLNKYLAEIRKGIINVCELHTHDSSPSMSKGVFEEAYIEKVLAQTANLVSVGIKAMTDGLAAQKEKEVRKILQGEALAENKEDKQ